MNALELTTLINTLSVAISKNLKDEELSFLAAIFTQIGDTLATIAINRDILQNKEAQK